MIEWMNKLAAQSDFMPHGYCFKWDANLLWLNLGSDIITGISYYVIAGFLVYFVFIRRDVPFNWIFILFGLFIFTCGTTHLMSAWTVYVPSYWMEGGFKGLNAVVSTLTAVILFPLVPKLIALPSLQRALDENSALNKKLHLKITKLQNEISKRKQVEGELKESEDRFRGYFELGRVGLAETSPEKGWIRVNKQLCQMLGYSKFELKAKTWAELTHPDDLAEDVAQFNRMLAGEFDSYALEKRFICKDGQVIDTIMSVRCQRHADQSVSYCVAALQDVTDLKQAEAELQNNRNHLEELVALRTKELNDQVVQMRKFTMLTAERELRIQEMRQENESLQQQLDEGEQKDVGS